jgi:hypothetical protein
VRPGSPRILVALTVAGVLGVAGTVALVLASDHETDKAFQVVAGGIVAPSFMGTGSFVWWRRPRNRTGLLMYAVGAAFLLTALKEANAPAAFDLGLVLSNVFIAVVAHLLVAFPTGRLQGRVERRLVGVFYASTVVLTVAPVLFKRSCGCTTPQPRNVRDRRPRDVQLRGARRGRDGAARMRVHRPTRREIAGGRRRDGLVVGGRRAPRRSARTGA